MIAALTRLGVTIVSTVEIEENFTSMDLSNFTVSFLADDIVRLRYVSINGQLRKMLLVVKMRRSEHSIDMGEYQITSKGSSSASGCAAIAPLTSGIPSPWPVENPTASRRRASRRNPRGAPGTVEAQGESRAETRGPPLGERVQRNGAEMNEALLSPRFASTRSSSMPSAQRRLSPEAEDLAGSIAPWSDASRGRSPEERDQRARADDGELPRYPTGICGRDRAGLRPRTRHGNADALPRRVKQPLRWKRFSAP